MRGDFHQDTETIRRQDMRRGDGGREGAEYAATGEGCMYVFGTGGGGGLVPVADVTVRVRPDFFVEGGRGGK